MLHGLRTMVSPTIVTNCSNNYGSVSFPEKLIPLVILNALDGKVLPITARRPGFVTGCTLKNHARALYHRCHSGKPGETYNIGGQ